MIGIAQAFFAFAVSDVIKLDGKFAVVGALIPSFSLALIYSGPLQYEGLLLSFTAALFFSILAYLVFSKEESKSLFTGYSCSLFLESLTFSYLPLFYPFYGFQGLGLFSSLDPIFNLAVVSSSVLVLLVKRFKS